MHKAWEVRGSRRRKILTNRDGGNRRSPQIFPSAATFARDRRNGFNDGTHGIHVTTGDSEGGTIGDGARRTGDFKRFA